MSSTFDRVKALRSGVAIVAAGLLLGVNAVAPAAYAKPIDPGDGTGGAVPCLPQPGVSGDDGVLNGTLHLLDGPLVGFDTRISMDGASLKIPNPKCEGEFLNVPLKFAWSISGRPSGSNAGLTQSTTLTPHLVPDKVGAWQVNFVACPNGCTLASPNIRIAPITRVLSSNAVKGVEGRISSNTLDSTLKLLLAGSRLQISQTGAGQTVAGSQSFMDFGPIAEQNGAPPALALPIDPPVEDVPDSIQAILLASQGPLAV